MRAINVQPSAFTVAGRYEIRESPIGQGGMGVVYKAYDTVTRRNVALKTISGLGNSMALSLFEKEWSVLARLSHPNIVDILETGQFEENGQRKPFFVMPLLPGMTLDRLIQRDSHRLTVERTVEIIAQTCRGLQAAHDQGLVHRDIKPSNIFVLDDDSIKIIDFGVVHLAEMRTVTGMKGTLQYVAPELLAGKAPSPLSDIYALAVVCYEALTGRKPFARPTEDETAEAIRKHIPPPAFEINTSVNQLVSRTVHKAMAKQPLHRFSGAREFADVLKKALRNEPIEYFDSARIQPRIERVKKAQAEGDYQFAREILYELEAEGHLDPQIPLLRVQLDQAIQQKTIRQLLENARTRIEEEEYPLALQKIQEILEIDPQHTDALHIKAEIEQRRSERQVDQWYHLVHEHIGNQLFPQARQGLEEILRLRPNDVQAHALLAQVDQQEKESVAIRKEREHLYESALYCYHQGEISTALDKLERVLALSRTSPGIEGADKEAQYQSLYKQIRSEREAFRNAYADAKRYLEDKNFNAVLALCTEFLKKNPADPLFQALKLEAGERERQEISAAVAETGRRVDAEADLDRQISILKEATQRYPQEPHFQDNLKLIRERRDLVNSIVNRARQYEQRSQFSEALGQWDILRNIYRKYPGLDVEVERLTRKRDEQARGETKSRWVRQVDQHLEAGDYEKAQVVLREALNEFPGDRELISLEKLIAQRIEARTEAQHHFDEGAQLCKSGDFENGISNLRKATELDRRNRTGRAALLNALLEHGRALLGKDWQSAKPLIQEALQLEETNPVARSLFAQIQDQQRQAEVETCVWEARDLQTAGDLPTALQKVQAALKKYPNDMRLSQLQTTLLNNLQSEPSRTSHREDPQNSAQPAKRNRLSAAAEQQEDREEEDFGELEPAAGVDAYTAIGGAAPESAVSPGLTAPSSERRANILAIRSSLRAIHWRYLVFVALLIITAAGIIHLVRRPRPVSAAKTVPVELRANVDGVQFKIDGQPVDPAKLSLEVGREYVISALRDGYEIDAKKLTLSASSSDPIEFTLAPLAPKLSLSSDLKKGSASLGEEKPVFLQSGEFVPEALGYGMTTLKVWDGKRLLLELPLDLEPGKPATLSGAVQAKDCSVVVLSTLGSSVRVYASPDLKGNSGTLPPQPIPPEGITFDTKTEGAEFNLSDGRSFAVPLAIAPTLSISLSTSSENGTLQIQANVADARVKIDGKLRKDPLSNGSKTVLLETGKHKIQVIASGYSESEIREVAIEKGKVIKEAFSLSSLQAQLSMDGVEPGAAVYIDEEQRGSTSENGSFKVDLSPGPHRIGLKKRDYEDSPTVVRDFKANAVESISAAQLPLLKEGSLTFNVTPADAIITLRLGNEAGRTMRPNETVFLKKGAYTYVAEAGNFESASGTVLIDPGKSTSRGLSLQPIAPQEPVVSNFFESPSLWGHHGDWWSFKGAGYGWLNTGVGTFNVIIEKQRGALFGKKKAEWVLDYRGPSDKITYTASGDTLTRQVITGGSSSSPVKIQFREQADIFHFIFDISRDRVVILDNGNNQIDEVQRVDPSIALGQTGFHGEISLAIDRLK